MGTPHKHAEVIKAWADGEPIQIYDVSSNQWVDWPRDLSPAWSEAIGYRVKPKEPRRFWINVYAEGPACLHASREKATLACIGGAETIEVVEMIK